MHEDFGPNFITLTDEEGNDIELEYVDALEYQGVTYMAFFPAGEDAEGDPDYGLVILRSETVNGEEMLATVDDEDILGKVCDLFTEQFLADDED